MKLKSCCEEMATDKYNNFTFVRENSVEICKPTYYSEVDYDEIKYCPYCGKKYEWE